MLLVRWSREPSYPYAEFYYLIFNFFWLFFSPTRFKRLFPRRRLKISMINLALILSMNSITIVDRTSNAPSINHVNSRRWLQQWNKNNKKTSMNEWLTIFMFLFSGDGCLSLSLSVDFSFLAFSQNINKYSSACSTVFKEFLSLSTCLSHFEIYRCSLTHGKENWPCFSLFI